MATYAYAEPAIFESEYQVSPIVQAYYAATGHTTLLTQIHRGDLVTLTAGALARSLVVAGGSFAALISGLAIHDETAVFASGTTGVAAPPGGGGIGNLFGVTATGTLSASGLLPAEPGQVHVNKLTGGQIIEFSFDKAVAWAPATHIGVAVYLYLDAATNLFYVSPTSSGTTIGTVINVVVHGTQGLTGDFGVRVLVALASTIVN